MARRFSVLVPHRGDGGHRSRTWAWLQARWSQLLPDAEVIVDTDDGGEGFNHPLAINRAAKRATTGVLLVADADVAFDPDWVRAAVEAVEDGAPWVLPQDYAKLTEAATMALLGQPSGVPITGAEEWRGSGVSVAGLVVLSIEGFATVGGYDERFTKWGADDVCFAAAMDTLVGPVVRLAGAAFHLWHPQSLDETYGHDRHRRQHDLMERYVAARDSASAMRAVRFA